MDSKLGETYSQESCGELTVKNRQFAAINEELETGKTSTGAPKFKFRLTVWCWAPVRKFSVERIRLVHGSDETFLSYYSMIPLEPECKYRRGNRVQVGPTAPQKIMYRDRTVRSNS